MKSKWGLLHPISPSKTKKRTLATFGRYNSNHAARMIGMSACNAVHRCQDLFLVTGLRISKQTKPRPALAAFPPIQHHLHATLAFMPPKRTRITEVPTEEPVPKRTLRSRGPLAESKKEKATTVPKKESKPKKKVNPKKEDDPHSSRLKDSSEEQRSYWLMKAEPETRMEKGKDMKFSIDDLKACKEPAGWDGVRNYGARNNLKSMRQGDLAFFYHSNCKEPGIVGIMEIVKEATPDETAFDPAEPYYDPKSSKDDPKWFLVHVEFRRKLERQIGLAELKRYAKNELSEMPMLNMSRLSVSGVPKGCWDFILSLEELAPSDKQ